MSTAWQQEHTIEEAAPGAVNVPRPCLYQGLYKAGDFHDRCWYASREHPRDKLNPLESRGCNCKSKLLWEQTCWCQEAKADKTRSFPWTCCPRHTDSHTFSLLVPICNSFNLERTRAFNKYTYSPFRAGLLTRIHTHFSLHGTPHHHPLLFVPSPFHGGTNLNPQAYIG